MGVDHKWDNIVQCNVCVTYTDLEMCRVESMRAATFKCNKCHTKQQLLRRQFGQWPIESFIALSADDRAAFFRDTACDRLSLKSAYESLTTTETHEQVFSWGGDFCPLSVWAARGYNPHVIQQCCKPDDKMTDAMFGTVYRVRVFSKRIEGRTGTKRESVGTASATGSDTVKQPRLAAIADGQPGPSAAAAAAPSDDSSDSSSASSSSSDKKKKKSKKSNDKKRSKKNKKDKQKKDNKQQNETAEEKKERILAEKATTKEHTKKLAEALCTLVSGAPLTGTS